MHTQKIQKLLGLLSLIGSICLFLWWFSVPLFLPLADAEDNFQNLVLDPQMNCFEPARPDRSNLSGWS